MRRVEVLGGIGLGLCVGWLAGRRGPVFFVLAVAAVAGEAALAVSSQTAVAVLIAAVAALAAHRMLLATLRRNA